MLECMYACELSSVTHIFSAHWGSSVWSSQRKYITQPTYCDLFTLRYFCESSGLASKWKQSCDGFSLAFAVSTARDFQCKCIICHCSRNSWCSKTSLLETVIKDVLFPPDPKVHLCLCAVLQPLSVVWEDKLVIEGRGIKCVCVCVCVFLRIPFLWQWP